MDFSLEPARQVIVNRFRDYVERELIPLEADFLAGGFGAVRDRLKQKRAEARRLGLWGPIYPHEHGGLGLDLVTHGLISEALGRCPFAHYVCGCNAPDAGNVELLHEVATTAQK